MSEYNYELIPVYEATKVRFCTCVDNGSYSPYHWHDAVEIMLHLEGDQTFMIENQTIEMQPGQCLLVNPNIIHSTRCFSKRGILFQIPISFLETYMPDIHQVVFTLHDPDPDNQDKIDQLKMIILEMQYLNDNKTDGGLLRFNSLLFEFLFILYQNFTIRTVHTKNNRRGYDISRLAPVLSYTAQHYNRPISIEEISAIAGFQPQYFCRFFKKCMGVTFLEYQNELRLSYIYRDLLYLDINISISSILEKHGFTNYKVFRKMFLDRFHVTPSELRKQRKSMPNKSSDKEDNELKSRQVYSSLTLYEGEKINMQ